MFDLSFESMGTLWQLSVDVEKIPDEVIAEIKEKTNEFDQQYSRFIPTSEANKFRNSVAGTYPISKPLAEMLKAAKHLNEITDGAFDVSIATLLEEAGYDQEYNFQKAPESINWKPPHWSIKGTELTIDGPVVFDIGGIGKGYWIDELSKLLTKHNLPNHLVDGGGDMYATQKKDGSSWRVALEYPGKKDMAMGVIELNNQGLAVSDTFKRNWKNWNHLVNAKTGKPIETMLGNAATAPTAFLADQMTSCLSFGQPEKYFDYTEELQAEYLIMKPDHRLLVSRGWSGELF